MVSVVRPGLLFAVALTMVVATSAAASRQQAGLRLMSETSLPRTRLLLLTDIGNEPDDSESFVRFLVYANEFEVEGLVATTSTHMPDRVQPHLLEERVRAYGKVLANLRRHSAGYPDAAALLRLIRIGSTAYGMAGVGDGKDTAASRLIVEATERADDRPLWIPIWGGAADLAQALWTVRATRSTSQVAEFVAKLRVYSISDQDNAGPWIRRNFPDLFWIASVHGWNQYRMAAWTGISGDLLQPVKRPGYEMVTNQWLQANIRKGPLGALYPPHMYAMEGDTPSLLHLIPNGLGVPEHPDYGGWGGRYVKSDLSAGHYGDAVDTYVDNSGQAWSSNQATIFRWRQAFQNDFAARMSWTVSPSYNDANHTPKLTVNGIDGRDPIALSVRSGDAVNLSAAGSTDPDRDQLDFRWWYYPEPSGEFINAIWKLTRPFGESVQFTAPEVKVTTPFHLILEVKDSGTPVLTAYRRIIVTVAPR